MASITEDWGSAPRATAPAGDDRSATDAQHGAEPGAAQWGGRGDGGEADRQQHRGDERSGEAVDDACVNAQTHGGGSSGWRATPSRKAACCQGLRP